MKRVLVIFLFICSNIYAQPTINTVAGNGYYSYSGDGGVATSAQLYQPSGVAVDRFGNLFIADYYNNRIREVNTSGIISTIAGTGVGGYTGDGGPAISAQLNRPQGLALDILGNLYIAEGNHVRKITPSGTITTFAGNGISGFSGDGGPANAAKLKLAIGIAVDRSNNIYIADASNQRIRKVNNAGIISTIAGNGSIGYSGDGGLSTSAQLNSPWSIALDTIGNLYISDYGNNVIRKVNTSGVITTIAGTGTQGYSGDGGPASSSMIHGPEFIVADTTGNLFFSDTYNNRVRKINASGIINTVVGNGINGFSGDGGSAAAAKIYWPAGLAYSSSGNLFVADQGNNRIRLMNISGTITTVAGTGINSYSGDGGLATSAQINNPVDVSTDASGNLYIADTYNHRVRMVNNTGIITTIAGNGAQGFSGDNGPATSAQLNYPTSVSTDAQGNIYIADQGNNRIRKINTAGTITTIAGTGVAGYSGNGGLATFATLNAPSHIAINFTGELYIAELGNYVIRKINSSGIINTFAGNGSNGFSGDGGLASSAMLSQPNGIALDGAGSLYIADTYNQRIRKVDGSGMINTIAGNGLRGYTGDGSPATSASLHKPYDVEVDFSGNLFIADDSNHVIRKVNPGGIITTVVGNGINGFSGDGGPAIAAQLSFPQGIAINSSGSLFIADWGNQRIRQVSGITGIDNIVGHPIEAHAYPNPFDNSFYLDLSFEAKVDMYDANGRLVYSALMSSGHHELEVKCDKGVYLLLINGWAIQKMIRY